MSVRQSLTPRLFNEYIDDFITTLKPHSKGVYCYADDMAILCEDIQKLNKIITIIENWCQRKHM